MELDDDVPHSAPTAASRTDILDLTSLALPDGSTDHVEEALCNIQADWLERKITREECCLRLFDAIAAEVLAVHSGEITPQLEGLPAPIFDIALEKGWFRFEQPRPAERPIRFRMSGSRWIPPRPDWFGDIRSGAPEPPAPPVKLVKLGHHEVTEAFGAWFRALFAGRIERWSGKARFRNSRSTTPAEAPRPADSDHSVFRQEGEFWTLAFDGKTVHVRDSAGLRHIAELLRKPRVPIEAAVLAGTSVESTQLTQAGGLPMADATTLKAVQADLAEKRTALTGLKEDDWPRRGTLQDQISKLEQYLGEVATHQGQTRKLAGTAQRSRTTVTNAINRAIKRISKQHPRLGLHLKKSTKTGTAPMYTPADEVPDWHFS